EARHPRPMGFVLHAVGAASLVLFAAGLAVSVLGLFGRAPELPVPASTRIAVAFVGTLASFVAIAYVLFLFRSK
ncbi:MAG: hypothetical protein ACT4PT_12045, partial [Methanobacteriota archaeon]